MFRKTSFAAVWIAILLFAFTPFGETGNVTVKPFGVILFNFDHNTDNTAPEHTPVLAVPGDKSATTLTAGQSRFGLYFKSKKDFLHADVKGKVEIDFFRVGSDSTADGDLLNVPRFLYAWAQLD